MRNTNHNSWAISMSLTKTIKEFRSHLWTDCDPSSDDFLYFYHLSSSYNLIDIEKVMNMF